MPIQVLTFGQAYQISLQLEMPDSPANQALGMFMIKTAFFSQDGGQVASSAHSVSRTNICSPSVCTSNQIMLLAPAQLIYCCIAVCFLGKSSAVCLQLSLCEYNADAQ